MESEKLKGKENSQSRIPFFRGMRGLLFGWFVLLAVIPMILVSVTFFSIAEKIPPERGRRKNWWQSAR